MEGCFEKEESKTDPRTPISMNLLKFEGPHWLLIGGGGKEGASTSIT